MFAPKKAQKFNRNQWKTFLSESLDEWMESLKEAPVVKEEGSNEHKRLDGIMDVLENLETLIELELNIDDQEIEIRREEEEANRIERMIQMEKEEEAPIKLKKPIYILNENTAGIIFSGGH